MTTSVTGLAVPSLDVRIANQLGLRDDVKRVPLFGLGCVAGAAGIARIHDYLQGHPDDVAVLLSVELCSLTFQRDDASTANLVGSGLVPDIVDRYLRDDVEAFLAGHGLAVTDVGTWIAHPGGPKVIEAIVRALGLKPDALDVTRRSLASVGNLSSSSVLHVLQETLAARDCDASLRSAVILAMGPGFCSELVLLDW